MKLISLYIENFGGLHRYELEFSSGLTVIQEANGFGKTTLAEFIRAMLYGFPRKAKTLDKSRRQKYTPWQGGKFGGNLVFQLEGETYRIERTFGATPKGDHFQVIDLATNKKSDRFSEEIGLEIFGLDADSFERSTYMPQLRERMDLTTDSIRAKLGDLVEDTGDVGNFEKAIATLRNKRSSYIPYRGTGGIVGDATARISRLQEELDRTQAKEGELKACREALNALEQDFQKNQKDLDAIRKEITAASEMAATAAVHDQHRALAHRAAQAAVQLAALETAYPAGLPQDKEIENCRELLEKRKIAQAELENTALTPSEAEQLREAGKMAEAGLLDETRLENLARDHRELEKVRSLLENLEPPQEELPAVQAEKKSALPAVILLVLGLGAMASGIVLLALSRFALGGVILGVGLLGLLGGIFGLMRSMMARELARQRRTQAVSDRQAAFERKREMLEAHAKQLEEELFRNLGRRDFAPALEQLRLARSRCLDLQERAARIREKRDALTGRIRQMEETMAEFCGSWGIPREADLRDRLRRMEDDRRRWCDLTEQVGKLAREREVFEGEHRQVLGKPLPEETIDLPALKAREEALLAEASGLTREILQKRQLVQNLRSQLDRVPELQDRLEASQIQKKEGQATAELLDETMDFLQKAKDSLSSNYLGPIQSRFREYLAGLTGAEEKMLITGDLEVQLERQGQARELGYFSAGQVDAVMLCMRFALVDALFTGEKPFVILDDPFVNLDDEHTAQALELLGKLAQERQILYLVCNSSRAPK